MCLCLSWLLLRRLLCCLCSGLLLLCALRCGLMYRVLLQWALRILTLLLCVLCLRRLHMGLRQLLLLLWSSPPVLMVLQLWHLLFGLLHQLLLQQQWRQGTWLLAAGLRKACK
jgi:hypothetical protein